METNRIDRAAVTALICRFARAQDGGSLPDIWRTPLVTFGDARQPGFAELRTLVHPEHVLPEELLPGARTVVAYFFPFRPEIGESNRPGRLSSREWAMAYEKTNAAFGELNAALIAFLAEGGVRAAVTPEAFCYDRQILKSRWSQRHVARLCGLGTFGKNNMLITEKGCCGRIGTVVTELDVPWDPPIGEEYCLYRRNGGCGVCIANCPSGALTREGYDRFRCEELCAENEKVHVGFGCSYGLEGAGEQLTGTNTCGKCVVGLPCTYRRP